MTRISDTLHTAARLAQGVEIDEDPNPTIARVLGELERAAAQLRALRRRHGYSDFWRNFWDSFGRLS